VDGSITGIVVSNLSRGTDRPTVVMCREAYVPMKEPENEQL
jgi:hypothetical protein